MNLAGPSIYVPEKHSNTGISVGSIKPLARMRLTEIVCAQFLSIRHDHWFWSVVAAWDVLDELTPETLRREL